MLRAGVLSDRAGRVMCILLGLLCADAVAGGAGGHTWVDDLLDPLPLVSQMKTVWHFARNEHEKAIATSDRFTRRCPGISQLRSLVEIAEGDTRSAVRTQSDFLNQPGEFVKDFVARESISEAEKLGKELTSAALSDLKLLMDDAIRRLPSQSKSFFMQFAQSFCACCVIWNLFQSKSGHELKQVLGKGALTLLVLLCLDIVMTAALDETNRQSECCPCNAT
ncbi:hypothetical protein T492DRAFT_932317 [Pavlovales sp. CCMP2436]|nr:hypothetical protein T492DRAFT_932317 [Pavlovales sp. CCMP2436]|mmetsp:Transcript_5076/g.13161  ORF Transcript_5076/g.13161 Transcript_5076/m.13161 type:complete len:222 (+) Transcript_5076:212-877(+)